MGASEVKEITVFVICTKSKQIFVLKQYLVLTLHCLHAPLYSQIHSDTLTLIYTHTHSHMQTDSKQQSFSTYSVCPVRFNAVLSLPLFPSLSLSPPLSHPFSLRLSLLSIDCRQSTVLSVDIRCLFAAAAGHNEKHELYKQNKQSKHTFEEGVTSLQLPL